MEQMDYWCVWDDWAWEIKYPSWWHGIRKALSRVTLAVVEAAIPDEVSDNAPTMSALPYMSNALSFSSDSAQLAARLYPMISHVSPNPAATRLGVAHATGEPP